MAPTATRRGTKATAPVVEDTATEDDEDFEELEDGTDEDELEELEDEAQPEEKPKAKRTPPVRPKIDFGSPELAAYVTEKTGETYDARAIRMLLRKMASDGVIAREVGVDKGRYEFSGPNDPTVKAVLKMVQDGTAKKLKQDGLQKLKDQATAKREAAKAAKAAEAETEDEMDEADDEVETPTPAPRKTTTRKATASKAAPAKAAPTTRRRASAAK